MRTKEKFGIFFLRRLLKYSSYFTYRVQKKHINKLARLQKTSQPVFILGVPRSGTTLIYQLITNYFDVKYPDNLVYLSRENPFLGFYLSNKMFGNSPHNCFKSNRGETYDCGLHAPNQSPVFWRSYVSKLATHSEHADLLFQKEKEEIYKNIFAIINNYQKPLVMKGGRVGNNFNTFIDIFSNARFIHFTRNPLYIAQSLLNATRSSGLSFENTWLKKLKPYNYNNIYEAETIYRKIALFVYALLLQNRKNLNKIPNNNYVSVTYEELFDNVTGVFQRISHLLGENVEKRQGALIRNIEKRNIQKIDEESFYELKKEINRFDWDKVYE